MIRLLKAAMLAPVGALLLLGASGPAAAGDGDRYHRGDGYYADDDDRHGFRKRWREYRDEAFHGRDDLRDYKRDRREARREFRRDHRDFKRDRREARREYKRDRREYKRDRHHARRDFYRDRDRYRYDRRADRRAWRRGHPLGYGTFPPGHAYGLRGRYRDDGYVYRDRRDRRRYYRDETWRRY